ncbi:MAG: hypothetical protein Cpurp_01910 [Chlorogloea purpurea SAG 13.99]|nr:hypothetical protein [Chlorogloea purpurea SAG 13.99]
MPNKSSFANPVPGFKRSLSSKTDDHKEQKKPAIKRPIIKAQMPAIDKVASANGELFRLGDTVLVTELGRSTPGSIERFYADASGEIWAQIKPLESDSLCIWQQACIQSRLLSKEVLG